MSNDKFYYRLKMLCDNAGKSINEVEKELNYPRNALHNYKEGRTPSGLRLVELSEFFSVSPEYLLGLTDTKIKVKSNNSTELQRIINRIRIDVRELEKYLK
ncbi:helix-turn-helix domain-containing protein [Lactococcus lactis]|uniref:Transcriptional regulator with XRE-family HTH domain n=1 Tax=Lactococcus lactis TaxID=1358 RepID=A0AAW5TQD0_9LACT|nr:helix-turn-helix transcriptional regulator [Lactococcus lactis]MCW2281527.1 transcriptional regulator with XRE-family HTH domain [Lactococcus lactis]